MTTTTTDMKWVARQEAAGWPSYARAVYALVRLGVPWAHQSHPPPDDPDAYMRSWYSASRRAGSGLAPEDVKREIEEAEEG